MAIDLYLRLLATVLLVPRIPVGQLAISAAICDMRDRSGHGTVRVDSSQRYILYRGIRAGKSTKKEIKQNSVDLH